MQVFASKIDLVFEVNSSNHRHLIRCTSHCSQGIIFAALHRIVKIFCFSLLYHFVGKKLSHKNIEVGYLLTASHSDNQMFYIFRESDLPTMDTFF